MRRPYGFLGFGLVSSSHASMNSLNENLRSTSPAAIAGVVGTPPALAVSVMCGRIQLWYIINSESM